jgi:hypothetical protein
MTTRKKDGKEHHYWSIVENHRISGRRVAQKHVLYLGEINDSQREAWWRSIEILEHGNIFLIRVIRGVSKKMFI